MHKAYETTVEGMRGQDPARDKVYVDVDTGAIVADYPQIHFAENRKVYTREQRHARSPGTLKRSEGQAATTDTDVNAAYDGTGDAYEAYKNFWNRDSYNNAGARADQHASTTRPTTATRTGTARRWCTATATRRRAARRSRARSTSPRTSSRTR